MSLKPRTPEELAAAIEDCRKRLSKSMTLRQADIMCCRLRELYDEEIAALRQGAESSRRVATTAKPVNLPPEAPFLAIESKRGRAALRRHPLRKESLRKRLEAASRAAGIPRRGGLGWLRHQAATLASASGQAIEGVSGALGHVDTAMVRATYDESSRAAEEKWARRAELGARIDALLPVALPEGKA